ncbi:hypothetical protein TBLA_0D04130 [Henningerozyma blattae CBS 6284]|uniref:F-box domain-containing protein n=1 Tax=Henningerozyma blattae (strain ATCC 34711 / CBS 6284 / DSM 70876 / NBRC 10599 / NRRL Y-10934 / UCD 77-7) TaxID=1071380 RepID=I2H3F8_HENB6|nr:hypothetical protein TBLA_0D04130 [Tetrapisispora blattae CBS 6284]CCH60910.1 hypothetical protein TBLA_0D04130 [Tetrapisispora blattae CBS 6284]
MKESKKRSHEENEENTNKRPRPGVPEYNFNKFCYRHNPDVQSLSTTDCKMKDLEKMDEINSKVQKLGDEDKKNVQRIFEVFNNANPTIRKLIIDGILMESCSPQLSYISSQLVNLIKIDFISVLPREISLKILRYLDCQSLCNAAIVSRSWQRLADDDSVWYHMCEQHIDKKCRNCGWGLPLLHMKRVRMCNEVCQVKDLSGGMKCTTVNPWKNVYRERYKVESNWRRGCCQIREFKGHMDGVLTLQFNYRLLFTGSYDSTIAIWDLYSGKLIRRLNGHSDGIKTLYFDENKLITGSLDKTIRVWDYKGGRCISTYKGHSDSILSVDCYKKLIVSGSADCSVKVWHIERRTCYTLKGHTEWVNCVKLHPTSFSCFSASDDCTIRMWDLRSNKCLKVFKGHVGQVQKVIPLSIKDIEGLVVDDEVQSSASAQSTADEPCDDPLDTSIPYPTHLLSCSLDNTIKLWDVYTGKCVRTQFGHVEGVWDIAADNFRIVSGSHDGCVKVWDLQSGRCTNSFQGTQRVEESSSTESPQSGPGPHPHEPPAKLVPIACVALGDSQFLSGDELGCVKLYNFDI